MGKGIPILETSTRTNVRFLPYGRQHVTEADIEAVVKVLRSDWLTQGPSIPAFENKLAKSVEASHAVACANGTAASHLAILALGIGPGDEVVTSPNTFLSSANCARFVGAEVRFADIDASTGLIDLKSLKNVLSADTEHKIKAVIPVHFAGQPTDLPTIHSLAEEHGARIVDDACHAIGACYEHNGRNYKIGGNPHADMTVFSFHPVKHVAMGEGGAITTDNPELAERLRHLRCHGMRKDDFINNDMTRSPDGEVNPWYYEMRELGYNYRLTDIQAALGISQLKRLEWSIERRNIIAAHYRRLLRETFDDDIQTLTVRDNVTHAYHLFVLLLDFDRFGVSRARVMNRLRESGIGTQVHYIPIHLQPYYRRRYGTGHGNFPNAENYYKQALSIPMYPDLTESDCERVVSSLKQALSG